MINPKDLAKGVANSRVAVKKEAPPRPTAVYGDESVYRATEEIISLTHEIDDMLGVKKGTCLKDTLDSMSILFNNVWKSVSKGKSITIYMDQVTPFEDELVKLERAVRASHTQVKQEWKEARKRAREAWTPVDCESGKVYVPAWKMTLLTGNLQRGIHTLLKGVPGAGKTEVGRAAAGLIGWDFFHMEVSGFTDVSQLEYERVILSKDGAPHMELRPTPLTLALRAVQAGRQVVLYIDEIKRVGDPSILNPFLLLLAQGEYHSVVTKDVFTVQRDRFVVLASANDAPGFNFSGNNRKGMDDALSNRFDQITFDMPPGDLMQDVILPARFPNAPSEAHKGIAAVYSVCQKGVDVHFNTRDAFRLMSAWEILGHDYTMTELLDYRYGGTEEQKKKLLQELAALGLS